MRRSSRRARVERDGARAAARRRPCRSASSDARAGRGAGADLVGEEVAPLDVGELPRCGSRAPTARAPSRARASPPGGAPRRGTPRARRARAPRAARRRPGPAARAAAHAAPRGAAPCGALPLRRLDFASSPRDPYGAAAAASRISAWNTAPGGSFHASGTGQLRRGTSRGAPRRSRRAGRPAISSSTVAASRGNSSTHHVPNSTPEREVVLEALRVGRASGTARRRRSSRRTACLPRRGTGTRSA